MPPPVIAGLFPGQGSQRGDIRERVERAAPDLLASCIALVGEDPFPRIADSTRFAQPAIYCASIAGWKQRPQRLAPSALAGHSLGELSALVASGALDPTAGLRLAVLRGELMASCARGREEGMLAVLGGDAALIASVAEDRGLVIANDNAPGQLVLAGPAGALSDAARLLRSDGARAMLLDVAGAFHSPAMAPAVEPYRTALDAVEFRPPTTPVISCSTAAPFRDIASELANAIIRPVRWRATMLALTGLGVDTFLDFGPGDVLARLAARNQPHATVVALWEASTYADPVQSSAA